MPPGRGCADRRCFDVDRLGRRQVSALDPVGRVDLEDAGGVVQTRLRPAVHAPRIDQAMCHRRIGAVGEIAERARDIPLTHRTIALRDGALGRVVAPEIIAAVDAEPRDCAIVAGVDQTPVRRGRLTRGQLLVIEPRRSHDVEAPETLQVLPEHRPVADAALIVV